MKPWALAWVCLSAAACAPEAAVWVRVEAPFSVPEESDGLEVTAHRLSDGAAVFSVRHDLASGPTPYPIEFALYTDNEANLGEDAVALTVRALKGDAPAAPFAQKTLTVDLQRRQWTHATIQICDCPLAPP